MQKYFKNQKTYELSDVFKSIIYKLGFRRLNGMDRPYYLDVVNGRVFNVTKHGKLRELKHGISSGEYRQVKLKANGRFKCVYVHRLVAGFILNHQHKKEVNHKDLDKSHNGYNNLEWVTHKENVKHYQQSIKKGGTK